MAKKDKKLIEPKYIPSPLNNPMINYRVYYMSLGQKIAYSLAIFSLGGISGNIFYGGLFRADGENTMATYISNLIVFLVVGLIALKFFLPLVTQRLKQKRDKQLQKQFIDFMEAVSTSLSAGNTVSDSFVNARSDLQNQYSPTDMIIVELSEIVTGMDNGKTLEEMMNAFGERSGNDDIENFANVISNCFRLGGNFKDVVKKMRDVIADKMAVADEIDTKLASNKLQHNVMSVMPIVLVGLIKLMNSTFAENLASPIGIVVVTISIAIFIGSYIWGRKIIDIR